MHISVTVILILQALFSLYLLRREGILDRPIRAAAALLLVAAAFAVRAAVFDYETLDYQNFLTKWVDFYRFNGGFAALDQSVGNYNIPYLYFMALFSYFEVSDLHLIKLLSVFFDVVLAWSVMKLTGLFTENHDRKLLSFAATLFLPTVFLNGALWAQCDSIYVALALLGIYLALDERPALSMVMMALSFGFKLQAVFILPVCAVLWMYGKYNWKHFLIFPLSYVLLVLPAVLLGRPFMDTVTLYLSQTGSIGSGLNYNSPSLFAIFHSIDNTALASKLAVLAAFVFMLAVLFLCYVNRYELNTQALIGAAALFAIGIPFLLPHMHERYFFAADILTLVMAFTVPRFFFAAVLSQFASLLGYHAYLKMRYLLPMSNGSAALIVALALAFIYCFSGIGKNFPENSKYVLDKS